MGRKEPRSAEIEAAGGRDDPGKACPRAGSYGGGHLGDLPNLIVEQDGTASIAVLAPRVKVAEVRGPALMVHSGADRYERHMAHFHGTGGIRIYCGVIE